MGNRSHLSPVELDPGSAHETESSFGQLLKRYRAKARLTQEQLAEHSGYSADYISKLERDQRQPPLVAIDRLAAVLGLGDRERQELLGTRQRHGATQSTARLFMPALLPAAPTPLIGRVTERAAVRHALEASRLVTLTGVGGTGKTRVALEVAREAVAGGIFADGVVFVDCAPLSDPYLLAATVTRSLGLVEQPDLPLETLLVQALQPRHLLLVVDSLEHLLEETPLLGRLLAAAPQLHVLATSRVPLHLYGEQEVRVAPLSLPAATSEQGAAGATQYDDPTASEAVQLFIARARAVAPDFAPTGTALVAVASLCVALDGLPLAIELAAARVNLFPPESLLPRLGERLALLTGGPRDRPQRQQTLRATLDWSHALLTAEERRLFARLGVFAGSFDAAAAATICAPTREHDAGQESDEDSERHDLAEDGAVYRMLARLEGLVDQSLLEVVPAPMPRFRLLETVRAYALTHLEDEGAQEAVRDRHLRYYRGLAERIGAALTGPEQAASLARLEEEHHNLRAALGWAQERAAVEEGLRLAIALWRFYQARGYLTEGRGWLEGLLQLQKSTGGAVPLRARAFVQAARLARTQGDYARAATLAEEGLELSRERDDRGVASGALITLGHVALVRGDARQAESSYQEALALARGAGDLWGIAEALHHLGNQALVQGEHARAVDVYEQSLALWRECGDGLYLGMTLIKLGDLATYFGGDRERAARLYEESLAVHRDLADARGMAYALASLAALAQERGDCERATVLAEESLHLLSGLGDRHITSWVTAILAEAVLKQGDAARALALFRQSLVLAQAVGDRWNIGFMLDDLGRVAQAQARPERAARLCGAAAALREADATAIPPQQQSAYDRFLVEVRQALGEDAFALAWERGRAMSLDGAIAYALEDTED